MKTSNSDEMTYMSIDSDEFLAMSSLKSLGIHC